MARKKMPGERRRISLYLADPSVQVIEEIRSESGARVSEIIRDSILLLKWVRDKRQSGTKFMVEYPDGSIYEQPLLL